MDWDKKMSQEVKTNFIYLDSAIITLCFKVECTFLQLNSDTFMLIFSWLYTTNLCNTVLQSEILTLDTVSYTMNDMYRI